MESEPLPRKLAAILYADVAGYSRLTGEDEDATHRRLSEYLDQITITIERYGGRVMHYAGDAVLAMFEAVVDALSCAAQLQLDLKARNADLPDERKVQFRIGVNMGDVIEDRGDIYGDGVNVAARLESLAEPGGICISESVRTAIGNKLPLDYEFMGEQQVKNIAEPVKAYSAELKADAVLPAPSARPKARRPARHLITATTATVLIIIGVGVITWLAPWAPTIEPASVERMAFPLPEQPSIAVLPFDNLSGDPAQDAIADGFTESLITTLAQMPELFVIARNSSFTYKGKPVKVKQVAEELGVRYVLEGSIQREGDTLRITAQLIDALKGHHLWADRYDRDVNAMFAVQDEITREIFTALRVKLVEGEHGRVHQQGTDNFEAYLTWLQGWKHFRRSTKDDMQLARKLILKAIDMDPDWAMPYTTVTWTHWKEIFNGWTDTPDESLKQAEEYAQKALALDDTYPGVYAALGAVEGIKGELDQAIAYNEKAVALGPNISVYQAILADNLNLAGRAEEAVALLKKAMRLEPTYQAWYIGSLGDAYTSAGKYEEAVEAYKQFLKRRPESGWGYAGTIVSYMWLGRENEAHRYAEKLMEIKPNFSLDSYKEGLKYKDAAYVERLLDTLRKAGLPDKPPLALPDKPSIAVLPFANMSDDPKQEYFVDGMTEDLITDLSKLSGLFVIARNSTFAYKGKSLDVRQVSRELGVKYVLEGSVRRAGEQVRINAQLIDATTGGHVWAERYDGSLANVFAMQDEVTQKIVTALAVNLTTEEKAARAQQETDSPEAYDAFLRGRAHSDFFTPDDLAKAIPYLERAIQLDPNYARAHSVLAALYWHIGDNGWAQSMGMSYDDTLKKMEHHLKEALKNPTPLAHHIASRFLTSQRRNDEALAEAKRAVALDPNNATGYIAMARVYNRTGRPAEGLEAMKKSMRLDPQGDVHGDLSSRLGESYFHLDRFEEAAAAYKKAQERSPGDEWRLLYLATTYGHLERKQEAQSALEKFNNARAKKGRRPYTLAAMDGWEFADETIRERFREGLRKAGVPPGAPSPPLEFRGVMKAPLEIEGATTIDATEAKALFDQGVPFVDVRGDPGWNRGHISGAVHLHVYHDVTEAKLSKVAAKDEEVVIYACGAGCGVTTRAVASAVSMGFKKVYFLRKGFQSWKAAGYPVEVPSG